METLNIKSNERAVFIGMTGSGKTVLATSMLDGFKRVVFFDPKHQSGKLVNSREDAVIVHTVDDMVKEMETSFFGKPKERFFIIYQPRELNRSIFNKMCFEVYKRANMLLVLDELMRLAQNDLEEYHDRIIRMGRSRGIGLWTLTQRPMKLDGYVLSENEHFFVFKVQMGGDRKKLEGMFGRELADRVNSLPRFHFVYYNNFDGGRVCTPIEI